MLNILDVVVKFKTRAKKCSVSAIIKKEKSRKLLTGNQGTFCNHNFKCYVQEHHFVYFFEVTIKCCSKYICTCFAFMFPVARSNRTVTITSSNELNARKLLNQKII